MRKGENLQNISLIWSKKIITIKQQVSSPTQTALVRRHISQDDDILEEFRNFYDNLYIMQTKPLKLSLRTYALDYPSSARGKIDTRRMSKSCDGSGLERLIPW